MEFSILPVPRPLSLYSSITFENAIDFCLATANLASHYLEGYDNRCEATLFWGSSIDVHCYLVLRAGGECWLPTVQSSSVVWCSSQYCAALQLGVPARQYIQCSHMPLSSSFSSINDSTVHVFSLVIDVPLDQLPHNLEHAVKSKSMCGVSTANRRLLDGWW